MKVRNPLTTMGWLVLSTVLLGVGVTVYLITLTLK